MWVVVLRFETGRYVRKLDGPDTRDKIEAAATWWRKLYSTSTYQVVIEPFTNPKG